jgi:hypothetical protein
MSDAIPAHVLRFLKDYVQSIAQLELLLLLYRDRDNSWTVEAAAKAQYTAIGMTQTALESLRGIGLLAVTSESEPRYQYAPVSSELDQLVAELAQLYLERRVTIINLIYSSPLDTLQSFADAFRIRKKETE